MCLSISLASIPVYHMQCKWRPEEGVWSFWKSCSNSCELPRGCLEIIFPNTFLCSSALAQVYLCATFSIPLWNSFWEPLGYGFWSGVLLINKKYVVIFKQITTYPNLYQNLFINLKIFYVYGCFVYMSVSRPHVSSGPRTRRRCQMPKSLSYRWLWPAMWVLGMNPGPLKEQAVVLTAESLLQPHLYV